MVVWCKIYIKAIILQVECLKAVTALCGRLEDSLLRESFIMQRLIIIYQPPTLCFALTYRFPKCQEERSGAVDPRAALLKALLPVLIQPQSLCSSPLLPSPPLSSLLNREQPFRHQQSLTWLLLFVILTGKLLQSIQHQAGEPGGTGR